ncbi:XRE family transcriptional regulator [Konateibacter massiliensis]|uniref:XRE family transcriptional regulator n=1 Tax=Konateibacter massiliensis TaxID=2002841 RepID=UPI000C148165|nr:XRE family transcriptional regulator [Konateibacter massiliensis]
MKNIGKKLSQFRMEKGLSQYELAERLSTLGLSASSQKISKWETDYSVPNAYQFLGLCSILDIRDVLEVFEINKNPLSRLSRAGQEKVDEYIELLLLSGKYDKKPAKVIPFTRQIKLFDIPVSAGTGQFLDSGNYELLDVEDTIPDNVDFALRISGNSMEPEYSDGQIVWVHQQDVLSDGEIGIFSYDNNAYCKKLSLTTAGTRLISLNLDYAPITIPKEAVLHVFGRVVGKLE